MSKIEEHSEIINYLHNLYITKNSDYGDSVHETYLRYGLTSFLVRIEDKLNRVRTLSQNGNQKVMDEKLEDSLLDLANYCILAVIERRDSNEETR